MVVINHHARAVDAERDPTRWRQQRRQHFTEGVTFVASPLMDEQGFTEDLEALYRQAWRDWCASQPGGSR